MPDTPANRARGVVGCYQSSSGITCPGAPSGGRSGGGGTSYYNSMMGAYNTGVAIGNILNRAFQEAERQAQIARVQQAIALNKQGIAAYNRGDFAGAANFFQQAIGLSPNDPNMRGNLAEAHKRLAEQRAAVEQHRRQQMAEAKARIEGMIGGLQDEFARDRSTLSADLGDATFVAPKGTSFFGLGGGKGGEPAPAKPGELAFVAPGDPLFSKGTKYSAPVDLRDSASDRLAASGPAGATSKAAEGGGLDFIAPDQPLKATVEAPRTAARPPTRESVAESQQASRVDRAASAPGQATTKPGDAPARGPRPAREPGAAERAQRLETLRAFSKDAAEAQALFDRLKRREMELSSLSPGQRRKLADLLRAGRGWDEVTQNEIAGKLETAADSAWVEGSRQYLLAKPGEVHGKAEAAGMGMAAFGAMQAGAGFAQYGGKMPVATAFSLGQSLGGLYAEGGLRKAGSGIVAAGDATEIVDQGFESALAPGRHLPGGTLPSNVVSATGVAGSSANVVLKEQEARQRFEAGDSAGGWMARGGAAASAAEAAAEGAKWVGKGVGETTLRKLGGVTEVVSGAGVVREGMKGSIDAAGNRAQAEINTRLLLENAESLGHQGRYYRQRAEIAKTARSDFGRQLLEQLDAAR